jgi:predicted RNase H-like nuclease (RuvC/YqgF family)
VNLIRRYRNAQHVISAKDARIRELETQLEGTQDSIHKLARSRGDVDHVHQLEGELRRLTAANRQLRAGVMDDEHVRELRRQLRQERAASKALEQRLAELQAANSGISTRVEVAA